MSSKALLSSLTHPLPSDLSANHHDPSMAMGPVRVGFSYGHCTMRPALHVLQQIIYSGTYTARPCGRLGSDGASNV